MEKPDERDGSAAPGPMATVATGTAAAEHPAHDEPTDLGAGKVSDDGARPVRHARERIHSLAENAKEAAAGQMGGIGSILRRTSEDLATRQHPALAQYTGRAAEGLDRLAQTVRRKDLGEMLNGAERFARRQPALVIGGVVAGGFLLARLLKSSSRRS